MDADKIKAFFILHVEKMILVLVIGVAGFLLYSGWTLPHFTDEQQPDRLSADATQVKSDIDEDHTAEIIPPRIEDHFDIVERTKLRDKPVDPSIYKLFRTWEGKKYDSIVRRQDPGLLPPRAVITTPVVCSMAVRGSKSDAAAYALASLEDAEAVEKVEPKKKRPPRRSRSRRSMMDDGSMDMEMMMEDMYGMEDMMDMGMEMGMDMGMGPSSSGPTRRLDDKYDFGVRATLTDDKRNPEPSIGWFIAGTAVIPYREIYEAYEMALQEADQYDPRRDTPFYYNIEVQRADVTDKSVDQLVEEDWTKIWDRNMYTLFAAKRWSGFAPEIVPEDYRDDALTTWIPPVLLDDYHHFATHPLIPMISKQELKRQEFAEDELEDEPGDFTFDDLVNSEEDLVNPGQRGGTTYGMDMDMGGMMDMDYEMEGMSGMMMGMGMAMMGRGGIEQDPVEYKLIRFYDFAGFKISPVYGRKYVYRLRYAVNDPNFPFLQTLQPKMSSLAPEVAARVQTLMAEALQTKKRSFERWSDWSEPSEPTSLPTLEQYFAGPVEPGTINNWQVDGKDVEYTRDPPKGKIVASRFDLELGARIPMRLDITEGSVLSHKAEAADVVDPITKEVKKLPDAELNSGTTVVDLSGGAPLKITEDLKEPGLMLLFDQSGQLKVVDEVGDQESYRILSFADERGE